MDNWINDREFMDKYQQSHPGDNSLTCENNTLTYNGEFKVLIGSIVVQNSNYVNLNQFRIAELNPSQWKLEPYQLFFLIQELVSLKSIDKNAYYANIKNSLLNNNLNDDDKKHLDFLVDYYNALKTIEGYLSGDLYDSFKNIKEILFSIATKSEAALTEAETYIYNKTYDIYQKENGQNEANSSSNSDANSRGYMRTNSKLPAGAHFSEPTSSQDTSNLAFISVITLIVLMLAIVVGTITYLYS